MYQARQISNERKPWQRIRHKTLDDRYALDCFLFVLFDRLGDILLRTVREVVRQRPGQTEGGEGHRGGNGDVREIVIQLNKPSNT